MSRPLAAPVGLATSMRDKDILLIGGSEGYGAGCTTQPVKGPIACARWDRLNLGRLPGA